MLDTWLVNLFSKSELLWSMASNLVNFSLQKQLRYPKSEKEEAFPIKIAFGISPTLLIVATYAASDTKLAWSVKDPQSTMTEIGFPAAVLLVSKIVAQR
jgi:hypothetical protein